MWNIVSIVAAIVMIAASVATGVYLGVPLTLAFLLFVFCALKNGHSQKSVLGFARLGLKKAFIVVKVLLLISICSALFLASGCTATLIRYALSLLQPRLFLLLAFVIAAGFSMLQGSAFAAAATGGLVLYIIGCAGGVPPAMTAGAVLSGIYVGDRASPVSSSLALAASLCGVPHGRAFPLMLRTGLVPFLLAALFYLPLSLAYPLSGTTFALAAAVDETFRIGIVAVLPVLVLLSLCICRVKVTWCLLASAGTALLTAVLYQGAEIASLLPVMLHGFTLPDGHGLANIMRGGGLFPMIKSMYVVAVSCSLAVVLEEGGLIGAHIPAYLAKANRPLPLLLRMWTVSVPGAMLGCNQTMSLVLTGQLMKKPYEAAGLSNEAMMADLSLTATLLPPLIPWALAFTLPMSALPFEGIACLPFAAFLWLGPLYHLGKIWTRRNQGMPAKDAGGREESPR